MLMAGNGQLAALCGQAYGAKQHALVGTWLQIALVNTTLMFIPLVSLRLLTTPILSGLGVPQEVAAVAGTFTLWSGLPLIFELWYGPVRVYYASQNIVLPDTMVDTVYIFITGITLWVCLYYYDLGVFGVALAISIKRFLRISTFVGYCWWRGYHRKTWKGWNWSQVWVADRWKLFLKQTIPAMIGGLGEQVHLQASALFAARLGAASSAAFDLVLCLTFLIYALAWACAQGTGIRIARFLGEGRVQQTAHVMRVGMVLLYLMIALCGVTFYFLVDKFARFASTDKQVQDEIISLQILVPFNMLAFGGLIMMAEILMKQGRSYLVGGVMPLCTWGVGLTSSYFFSVALGLRGVLVGHLLGYSLAQLILGWFVLRSDWQALSRRARELAERHGVKVV